MATTTEVVGFILEANEEQLRLYTNAVELRRQTLNRAKQLLAEGSLYVGDRVVVHNDVTPKKIRGLYGTIVKIDLQPRKRQTLYTIELDNPPDYRWRRFGAPAHMFDKVAI